MGAKMQKGKPPEGDFPEKTILCCTDNQDAQGARAAVTGDGAACLSLNDVGEGGALLNGGAHLVHKAVLHRGVGDENPLIHQAVPVLEAILYLVEDALFIAAPVLFNHLHFAVDDLNAGLEVQQVRPQGHHHGAAATLDHVIETVK